MKKTIAFLITAIMTLSCMLFSFAEVAEGVYAAQQSSQLYSMTSAGVYDTFTNYAEGYELSVDKGMTVDMSYSAVAAVLENGEKRIEIYKQDMQGLSKEGYIGYSNQFLENTIDHKNGYRRTEQIGGYSVDVTTWERDKLARVTNDKNYYACLEIQSGGYIYTIFVKSSIAIAEGGGYRYLAESFRTFSPTSSGMIRTSSTVSADERGWNQETQEFYSKYFSEDASLSWGIFEPEVDYTGYSQLNIYEEDFDYEFPVILSYTEVVNTTIPVLKNRLEDAYENGKVLELTIQTSQAQDNMVYNILNGEYDNYLYQYAATIKDFAHPVLFRPFNEMNGDWCPYSAYNTSKDTEIFKEAYKYIYSIFESSGANENTIWVWNPNSVSYPNFDWNNALMYYPGDNYVDIVGMTAYNTGTYYSGEKWQSFNELYSELYTAYCKWFSQPLMITEFASSSIGGDKEAWMKNMFAEIKKLNRIKMAIWWDGCDWDANGNIARPYFLDETPATYEAFKKGIQLPWDTDVYA